ncbi:MAG: archaea-specific SMC-related protein [Haloarculaceae archaeon]
MSTETRAKQARVRVENVGGIEETTVDLPPGVSVLVGRNATNRTSFLQSLMAVLGGSDVSLKANADRGRVEMTLGRDTYTRELERRNDRVVTSGDPYLEDPQEAELFAFLLELNDARQGVARDENLRDLVVEPIDTAAIRTEIERLVEEKREIDDRLTELDERERELTDLRQERARLESEIERRRERLETVEETIEAADVNVAERRDDRAQLETQLADLQSARSDLEEIRFRLDTERESLESLRAEAAEIEAELADLEGPDADPAEIDRRLGELRSRKRSLDSTITELQSVIQFNRDALDDDGFELTNGSDDPAAGLTTDPRIECWTCGTTVDRSEIESTVDRLQSLREEKLAERNDLRSEIDDLQERKRTLSNVADRRRELERSLQHTREEIERREETVEDLEARRDEAQATVAELEETVEEGDVDDEYADLIDRHSEANQIEFELDRYEDELAEVTDEIDRLESALEERSDLTERRERIEEDLSELRTRIDRIERDAIEQFNAHMADVLDVLDYDNIERIWIERRERDDGSEFSLHVVRITEGGESFEDTVDHLSESEREVTGLVFALAGYLVYDVHEVLPFMLLDSLEAIDSDRIAALVEYFSDYVDYLVVALLPEDAAAVDDRHARIEKI